MPLTIRGTAVQPPLILFCIRISSYVLTFAPQSCLRSISVAEEKPWCVFLYHLFHDSFFSLFMKSVLAATYQNLVHIYTHKSTFTFCNKKKSRFKFSTLLSLKLVSLNIVSQTHSSKKGNSLVDCNFYTYTKEVIQQLVTTIWNFTFFFSLS